MAAQHRRPTLIALLIGFLVGAAAMAGVGYGLGYFRQLGIDEMVYPEHLGAQEIIASLKQVGIRQMFEFTSSKLILYAIKIRNNAPIVGKTLAEINAMHDPNLYYTLAVNRDGKTIIVHGKDVLKHEDLIYVITTKAGTAQLLADTGKVQYEVRNIMMLGGSRIGLKVAQFQP